MLGHTSESSFFQHAINTQISSVTIPKSKILRWVAVFRGASDGTWLQALHLQDVLEGLPLNSVLRQVGDGVGAPVALKYIISRAYRWMDGSGIVALDGFDWGPGIGQVGYDLSAMSMFILR